MASGSLGFDFVSDDILCSYEDYPHHHHQHVSNGTYSDTNNSAKEFQKSRMTRSSMFPTTTYSPPEESSFNQEMICTVEKTMKKHADNLMRFLEGISSRLSQLELYCYNLDKSIGEMRSNLDRNHSEADLKLKALEKHVQEVHRSVQILRDKQKLADTQEELAKLQLPQKEPTSASNSQKNEDRNAQPVSDSIIGDNSTDMLGQQLPLALAHQVALRAPLTNRPVEQPQQPPPPQIPSQSMMQSQGYYLPPAQMSNPPAPTHLSQGQYLSEPHYRTTQMQDLSRVPPQPEAPQGNQTPQIQSMPQYQQQWAQQVPQQVKAPQQVLQHHLPIVQPHQLSTVQQQARPSSPGVYTSYPSSKANPSPEVISNSMPIQVSFSAIPQSVASRPEAMSYGYDSSGRPLESQAPTQHLKPSFGAPGDGYAASGPHPSLSAGNTYLMYDCEGTRGHPQQPPNFPQSSYPPSSFTHHNEQSAPSQNLMVRPPELMRSHPYNELIEKLASMGYRSDHVVNVIQRLEESGQAVDCNTVLDRLNGHSSGGPQRGWSG